MTTTDHVFIENIRQGHLIYCAHCNAAEIVPLPMPMDDWLAATRRFQKAHRHCWPQPQATTALAAAQES